MNVPILMYHSISDEDFNLSVKINNFKKQLKILKKLNYKSVNFENINDTNIKKKIIITFDDGYEDIFHNALPLLKEFNFVATCFIVNKFIGDYNIWDNEKKNFYKKKLMTENQINEWIKSGNYIGSHTNSHYNLRNISYEDKKFEIINSNKEITKKFNLKYNYFSYPFGVSDEESINLVKNEYEFAVTTKRSRYKINKFNNHELPRIPINRTDSMIKFFIKLVTPYEDIKYK